MFFIGIITNSKNEEYITNMLSKDFSSEQIIFINDKNVNNMKNIRFETIVIDSKLKHINDLKQIVSNAKNIILNTDIKIDLEVLENLNLMIITYGFNAKATFTLSSVSENTIIICLQRIIKNIKNNKKYEPQEFEVKFMKNIEINAIVLSYIILLIYDKIKILDT